MIDPSNESIEHLKLCTACQRRKILQEFHRYGKGGSRIGKWCEPCFQRLNGRKKRCAH